MQKEISNLLASNLEYRKIISMAVFMIYIGVCLSQIGPEWVNN